MTALDRWQQQIVACRQERVEPDGQAWQRTAQWYSLWVEQNDYIEKTLARLRPLVDAHTRVLEIGPGSGGFTLPLADVVREIVAVEPSPGMRAVLAHNLAETGKTNVYILPTRIEEGMDEMEGPFDLALASFSLYNVLPIDDVLWSLTGRAHLLVALMGDGKQEAWYRDLYRRFRGHPPVSPPQVQFFHPLLQEMGLDAQVELVQTSANYVYLDKGNMVDQWMWRLRIDPSRRAELEAMLLPLTERHNGHIGIYRQRQMAMVWIRNG